MDITNNSGASITLDDLHVEWIDAGPQRIDKVSFGGSDLFNGNENNPPSDFPSEQAWDSYPSGHGINDSQTKTLRVEFNNPLDPGNYNVKATFNIGCFVEDTLVIP